MAFPGTGPRLGSGFPRPAAVSPPPPPTGCLASVTRDRAPRANSGVPRSTARPPALPQAVPLGSRHRLPHAQGPHLGPLGGCSGSPPGSRCCCFLGVCQGVGRVGWFQGSPHGHPSRSQAQTRKACVPSWPVTAASSQSDLLVPFLVLFCLLKGESENFSGQSSHELKL